MKKLHFFFVWRLIVLAAGCFASSAQAASVGPSGYTNDFSTLPPAADWSYFSIAGANSTIGSIADMDAAVQVVAASSIVTQVTSDTTADPPVANASGTWSGLGFYVETRPTGNAASLLMCTLVNNIGASAASVTLSYNFTKAAVLAEEIDGHRAYYSLTGAAGSWTPIPEFSSATPGRLTATLNIAWPIGGSLFVVWADDNAVASSPDTAMQIDNFSATAIPAEQVPVAITSSPQNQTVLEGSPVSFSVGASGNPPPAFQWFKDNNNLLSGATNSTYTIGATPKSSDGSQYYAVAANTVSNVNYALTSSVAILTVVSDTNPPVVVVTNPPPGQTLPQLTLINLIFSKPVLGVDASDLLINGLPATGLSSNNPNDFTFSFPLPATGAVQVAWAPDHGITDIRPVPNAFGGGSWSYILDTNFQNQVVISEFLADDNSGIKDDDGARNDWIELLNAGLQPASLAGWFLTDTPTNLTKWQFPTGLAPLGVNNYLLVWASQKDHTNPLAPLHTNFKLSKSAGSYLALLDPYTNIVSVFSSYPAQQGDISYGRDFADPSLVGYYTTPTPGAANTTRGPGFVPDPIFSLETGVYTNAALTLTISDPSGVGTIRYTSNATLPATNSTIYTGPLTISVNTTIKARIFPPASSNLFPSAVVARNFIMLDSTAMSFNSKLPTLIISTEGRTIQANVPSGGARTKGSLVVIDTTLGRGSIRDEPQVHELADFEIFGQTSAGFPKLPIRVEIQDSVGNDLHKSLLGMPADSDWKLRNPYDDKTLINDFLGFELWEKMGHYSVRRRLVEVFVDSGGGRVVYPGDYYGVMVLAETIKVGSDRVDIPKLSPYATNEPAITGGYIIKRDKSSEGDVVFNSPGGPGFSAIQMRLHEPKPNDIKVLSSATNWPGPGFTAAGSNQMTYLVNFLGRMELALYTNTWTTQTGTNHYTNYLDVERFADQMLHVEFTKQIDGYRLSDYFSKDRSGRFGPGPVWDWNLAFGNANYALGGQTNGWYYEPNAQTDHPWARRLITGTTSGTTSTGDPNFVQLIADRWAMFRTNVLNATNMIKEIDDLASLLGESAARDLYGKYRGTIVGYYQWPNPDGGVATTTAPVSLGTADGRDVDYVRPTNYAGPIETVAPGTANSSIIGQMKKWLLGRYLWMDSQFTGTPKISAPAGMVTNGFPVTVTPPAGAVLYYTLDGTDPRASGGTIASGALSNNGPVTITVNANMRVVARAKATNAFKGTFSAANAVSLYSSIPPLRITEIMYHPLPPPLGSTNSTSDFEYIEVKNIGNTPLNVNRFSLSGGVQFQFPNVLLTAGQSAVIVANIDAFQSRYGTSALILGAYTGSLNNAGDHLVLSGGLQENVLDFTYEDNWWPATDGFGFSLVTVDENATTSAWTSAGNWRASSAIGGSAGQDDPAPPLRPAVLVNEVMTHEDPPEGDAIELFNSTGNDADISGWFLTDDFNTPKKFTIPPGTIIPAGQTIVFYATNSFGVGLNSFGLGSKGDSVYLFSGNGVDLTGFAHGFDFGVSPKDATFGRYVISTGKEHFVAQLANTLGGTNAGPLVGPFVISTINYHPPDIATNGGFFNNTRDEYIELQNITGVAQPLFDPNFPTNTWHLRDAVDYTFPTNITIPSTGRLVVVSFDPSDASDASRFRGANEVAPETPLFGPFQGLLDNSGDSIELARPDVPQPPTAPDSNAVYYVLVDKVDYTDGPPWPPVVSGGSTILHRVSPSGYGNDPSNWVVRVSIMSQPQNQIFRLPDAATVTNAILSVTAGGSGPIHYQWRFNGTDIPGANGPVLSLSNVSFDQTGDYSVVVSNSYNSSTSSVARLTVYSDSIWRFATLTGTGGTVTNLALATNVFIWMQAAGEAYVDDVSFVPASGTYAGINLLTNGDFESPLNVGWLVTPSMTNSARSTNFAHSGSYSLHVVATNGGSPTPPNYITQHLPPIATNILCTLSFWYHTLPNASNLVVRTLSGSALNITANPQPVDLLPGIASQPRALVLSAGAAASFGVSAFGSDPLSYQWFKDGVPLANGGRIGGATTANLTLSQAGSLEMGAYSVKVSNALGFTNSTTASLTVVGDPPVITTQPQSQQAPCHGTVTFTVEASGTAPLTYQWIANQTVIVNATNASLTLTNLGLSDNGPYRVYVSNPVGSTNSLDALLVVQDSALVSLQVHRDGTNLVVSWPRSCTAFQLEENQTLDPATWSPIAVPIQDTDTLRTATIPIATPYKFYRLGN